jgi:hypothetical protein
VPQLPQRIPAEPDVPAVPGDDGPEGIAEIPDIARIVDFLRDDEDRPEDRHDGFDFPAVIEAVRGVVGVRDAELVTVNDTHTLRLDLADDADPGEVSRAVARLLKEQMGVSAEPSPQAANEPVAEPTGMLAAPVDGNAQQPVDTSVGGELASPQPAAVVEAPAPHADAPPEPADPDPEQAAVTAGPPPTGPPPTGPPPTEAPPTGQAQTEEMTDELAEPPELVPVIEPMPPSLAGLPRIGEPPPADSVRVAAVPREESARSGRAVRVDHRPLEARIAALESPLSFEDWLETLRPDRPVHQPVAADEHRSLVGMPTAPVFHDPLASEPEPEPVVAAPVPVDAAVPVAAPPPETDDPHPEAAGGDEPAVEALEEPAGPLVLAPGAPAVQVAGAGGRVRLERLEVANQGFDTLVQVRLSAGDEVAVGSATGPAVDQYVLRLCATATASALDSLLTDSETGTAGGRCYVEHAAVVPLGTCEVAVVVMLLTSGGWVEQLTGSALVAGDSRQAVVRATLAAANRRLDALLP